MVQGVAAFGWIIGPHFEISDGAARFRHISSENDVSAILSVPSWWKWAEVKIARCWIDERAVRKHLREAANFEVYDECRRETGKASVESYRIRLPGNVTEIARKLGLDVVRRPSVFNAVGATVIACDRAEIVIRGSHLWRSTVVTLEGQAADNITVLPDMKGILARFDEVSDRWVGLGRDLWVFTSEGDAFVSKVEVQKPQRECRRIRDQVLARRG
jgi:hypothetical protein